MKTLERYHILESEAQCTSITRAFIRKKNSLFVNLIFSSLLDCKKDLEISHKRGLYRAIENYDDHVRTSVVTRMTVIKSHVADRLIANHASHCARFYRDDAHLRGPMPTIAPS